MSRLKGKSALVLGAASVDNMGQIIARRFANEGAQVTVAGRNRANLQSLANAIGGSAMHCDITSKADIDATVAHTVDRSGPIDIAVNCTGWGLLTPFEETSEEDLVAMMNLQFKGPYQFMQALVTNMSDSASIIQISSATATILVGNHHAYIGTKAGIDHVIRGVADEFEPRFARARNRRKRTRRVHLNQGQDKRELGVAPCDRLSKSGPARWF